MEYTGQTRADYTFFLPITLRISDVDVNAHLNQSVYHQFFDTTVIRYLQQFNAYQRDHMTSMCVENGCYYRREVKFNDTAEVALRVAHIGTSSMKFDLAVFTKGHDDPNTIAYFALVFVDKGTKRPTPICAELKQALQKI